MSSLAPIVVFGFIRLDTLQQVIKALQNNFLALNSDLIIFIDGPRNRNDEIKVQTVKKYCETISGFKSVSLHISEKNKGLDSSVIEGITQTISKYGKVIAVEDDIVTTPNFLNYMNQALDFYQNNPKIMQIGAYGLKIKKPSECLKDTYIYQRHCSWGWATWLDRWESIDWQIKDWGLFSKDKKRIAQFNRNGSDMFSMLKQCMEGGNMWDIRVSYNLFVQNKYVVYPFLSKVYNVGYRADAIHCKDTYNRFKIDLDNKLDKDFSFEEKMIENSKIHKQVYHYHSLILRCYSVFRRILSSISSYK